MLDLKFFRENPEAVKAGIKRKKFTCDIDAVLELDRRRRTIIQQAEEKRAQQKAANQEMAGLDKKSPEFRNKVAEMKELSAEVKTLQNEQAEVEEAWRKAFMAIPNIPHESVPSGSDETDNEVIHSWGEPANLPASAKPHYEIPGFTHWVDLERGNKITGAGWPVFRGDMARLVRSLIQFFLQENTKAGYIEVMPPICVNPDSATATGQLPDKEGQMYHVAAEDLYLIPTSEVPVTNLFRDEILEAELLPLKMCAYTPCFRREAGSYGKEVRGLNRVHQFDKVELVKWVHPDHSYDELEGLREQAQHLLELLNLPYRTLLMCTGDIGFPHAKQYDLEIWAAGQERWLEVSSCSNFTDFQARRANIRFRGKDGKPQVLHTLNASGLAVPRVLAGILENNLNEDGSVTIPEVLRPWFGGDRLEPPPGS